MYVAREVVRGEGRRRKGWKQNISTAANDLELRMKLVGDTEKRSPKWPRYTRDPADGDPEDGSGKGPVGKPGAFVNGQQHRRSGTRRAGRHWRMDIGFTTSGTAEAAATTSGDGYPWGSKYCTPSNYSPRIRGRCIQKQKVMFRGSTTRFSGDDSSISAEKDAEYITQPQCKNYPRGVFGRRGTCSWALDWRA